MLPLHPILEDFLRGKSPYKPIRRIIDIIFSWSISSFLFEKFYYAYSFLNITDYKEIAAFFIRGEFFVPFMLFILVHSTLHFSGYAIFTYTTYRQSSKWTQSILRWDLKIKRYAQIFKEVNSRGVVPYKISADWFYKTYSLIKANTKPEQWQHAYNVLKEEQKNIRHNFLLAYKAFFAVIVYFITVPYFGWLFFSIVLLLIITFLVLLWYMYNWLEVLPLSIAKADEQLSKLYSDKAE